MTWQALFGLWLGGVALGIGLCGIRSIGRERKGAKR